MAEQMKPSGVSWIGDIPFDWNIGKVRFETKIRAEKGCYTKNDTFIALENVSSFTGKYIASETEYDSGVYDIYKKGDLLYNKLRPYLAKALIAKDTGFCTGELEVISKYNGDMRFLFYYMLSDGFLKIVDSSTYGTKMPRANWDYIKNLAIPLLSNQEQKAIADYLDGRCAEIDSIIADIEKQIELLKQYKKSLITETVTKGLDKSVPMKDSGIEFFQTIPSHWHISKTKYVADISIGLVTTMTANYVDSEEGGVPLIRNSNIRTNRIDKKDMVFLSKEFAKANVNRAVRKGDIVTVHTGDVGTSAIIDDYFDMCHGFATINSRIKTSSVNREYLCWLYNSELFKEMSIAYSTGDGRQNLNLYDFVDFYIPIPPINEQIEIVRYINKNAVAIDTLLEEKEKSKSLLLNHKKSLIYEYVTGKKRVKEAM